MLLIFEDITLWEDFVLGLQRSARVYQSDGIRGLKYMPDNALGHANKIDTPFIAFQILAFNNPLPYSTFNLPGKQNEPSFPRHAVFFHSLNILFLYQEPPN